MKKTNALVIISTVLLSAACATPDREANADVANQDGTVAVVAKRVAQGTRLSVGDIEEMGRRGVPEDVIQGGRRR